MRTLLVGYDLNRAGQNYDDLIGRLKQYSLWWHHLDSTWLIRTESTPVQVRDELSALIDSNDELLVIDVTGDPAAWTGFGASGSKWLKDHL